MAEVWQNVMDIIVQPNDAFQRLKARPMVLWGLLLVFLTQVISAQFSVDDVLNYSIAPFDTPIGSALLTVVLTVITTWIVLVIGKALGGHGTYPSLISAVGFAQIPSIFYAPLAVVSSWLGSWFFGLGSFAISVWIIFLGVAAIRESLHMTNGRAIGTLLLSALAVAVIAAIVTFGTVFSGLGVLGLV